MSSNLVYVGVKARVAAIDKNDGRTVWETQLKGGFTSGNFVTLLVEEGLVYAHAHGELFCLDAETGQIRWKNELKGLGYDIASVASDGISSSMAPGIASRRRANARSAGAAGT